jgi:hypothetical protein
MSNIKHYIATERFWETLDAFRDSPEFAVIRRKIDEVLLRKSENAIFRSDRDKPFDADPRLKGIWHAKLTTESDAILFYSIKGDAVVLGFIGSHKDYPYAGSNGSKVPSLVQRMRRAVEAKHIQTPAWKGLHWTIPDDLLCNRRLFELDLGALRAIREKLTLEAYEAPIFERVYGKSLLHATDHEFDGWLKSVASALSAVEAAARRVEIGSRREPRHGDISVLRKTVEDVAPMTFETMIALIRDSARAVSSVSGGGKVSAALRELVEVLELDPESLDGHRLSRTLGEAEELLLKVAHVGAGELSFALPQIQVVLENADRDPFAAHVASISAAKVGP